MEVLATYEKDHYLIEVTVELDVYVEGPDPSVGIFGTDYISDGYELLDVYVSYHKPIDDELVEWASKGQYAMRCALVWLQLGGIDIDTCIDAACDKECSEFDPRDYE